MHVATIADVERWKVEEAERKKKVHDKVMEFKAMQDQQIAEKDDRIAKVWTRHVLTWIWSLPYVL